MGFIEKYARVEESDDEADDAMSAGGDEVNDSDMELLMTKQMLRIRALWPIVLWTLLEICKDQSMAQELNLVSSDPENFVSDYVDEVEYGFDEFACFEKRI